MRSLGRALTPTGFVKLIFVCVVFSVGSFRAHALPVWTSRSGGFCERKIGAGRELPHHVADGDIVPLLPRVLHLLPHRDLCRVQSGVRNRAFVPRRLGLRRRRYRSDALQRVPKTSRSLCRRRPVVRSDVVVNES